jgi:hypothetical protein
VRRLPCSDPATRSPVASGGINQVAIDGLISRESAPRVWVLCRSLVGLCSALEAFFAAGRAGPVRSGRAGAALDRVLCTVHTERQGARRALLLVATAEGKR